MKVSFIAPLSIVDPPGENASHKLIKVNDNGQMIPDVWLESYHLSRGTITFKPSWHLKIYRCKDKLWFGFHGDGEQFLIREEVINDVDTE